jgi:hypothetical protein
MSSNLRTETDGGFLEQDIEPSFDITSEHTRGLVWIRKMPDGNTDVDIDIYVIRKDGVLIRWDFRHSIKHPGYETVRRACFAWIRDNNR